MPSLKNIRQRKNSAKQWIKKALDLFETATAVKVSNEDKKKNGVKGMEGREKFHEILFLQMDQQFFNRPHS